MDQALIYHSNGLHKGAIDLYHLSLEHSAIPVKIKTYRNLAILYADQNMPEQAGLYFDTCYMLINREKNISSYEIAYTNQYYAEYLITLGDERAKRYIDSALGSFLQAFGPKHRDVANLYKIMGDYYLRAGNPDLALKFYQDGLIAITPHFNDPDIMANPLETDLSIDAYSLEILIKKVKMLESIHARTGDLSFLVTAINTYDLLIYIIEQYARFYRHEDTRLLHSEEFNDLYKTAATANFKAYELTRDYKFLENAFKISEKSKAAVLLSAVKDENANSLGMVPDSLFRLEKSLRGNLYLYKVKIDQEESKEKPNRGKIEYMQSALFDNEQTYDSLINLYANRYPEYYRLKYDPSVKTIQELQELLKENQTILEFMLTDSVVFSFLIKKNDVIMKKSPISEDFIDKIYKLRDNLYPPQADTYVYKDFMEYQHLANEFHELLIAPVKEEIQGKNLIIIPDGELAYLSFESLTEYITDSQEINFKDLPYLLHHHTFTYSSSATIYHYVKQVKKPRINKGVLSMAPSYPLVRNSVVQQYGDFGGVLKGDRNLPGAFWEAETILKYIHGEKLSGSEATEASFKAKAAEFDILHFAMHTEIDDTNPLSSRLFFFPFAESPEDNVLHTYEIYNMRLKGHMAVLSACSTGNGKLMKGEGVISLARAFIIAGIPSIIMTLWDVEDLSSGNILPRFYYLYSKGLSKDEALRLSKLNYLNSVRHEIEAHPVFWSGIVLYGNNQSFKTSLLSLYKIWTLILVILLVIIAAAFIIKFRKFKYQSNPQNDHRDTSAKLRP